MQLIEDIYLGWQPLTHTIDCANPVWDTAEVRRDEGAHHVQTGAESHACVNDGCGHANTFGRVQIRLLCRDCHTIYTIAGEGLGTACTTTSLTGWGQPPRQVGGVWLWPGQPADAQHQPHDYLVTRGHADQVTAANLLGLITRYRDADGTPRWVAGAELNAGGAHQVHSLRWTYRSAGLADLADAAHWVATAQDRAQRPLVVAV